jgi:hypothetical protein
VSNRSLLEFNHDLGPRHDWLDRRLSDYALGIARYLSSGDKADLPDGVTFVQMRHHSDAAPTGWVPPQDREPGYRCLAFMRGAWHVAIWGLDTRAYWHVAVLGIRESRRNPPTAFAPLPEAPNG